MTTFERIKELADNQGKSLQRISEDLGFGVNYLYQLKNQQPTADKLIKLANYFDVSVDYLLGRSDFKNSNEAFSNEFRKIKSFKEVNHDDPEDVANFEIGIASAYIASRVGEKSLKKIEELLINESEDKKSDYVYNRVLRAILNIKTGPKKGGSLDITDDLAMLVVNYLLLSDDDKKTVFGLARYLSLGLESKD